MDAMSKKEKLARGSAVIKVMRVIPRPGHYLKYYIDAYKMPRKPKALLKGVLAEMPHLDVKNARFEFLPVSARVPIEYQMAESGAKDPCAIKLETDEDIKELGLPDGDKLIDWYGYRNWQNEANPLQDGNVADHFNIMLGLLISMAEDPDNQDFADVEAYPCVQFLRTIMTPDGTPPYNVAMLISYIEYIAQKMLDEG